MINMKLDEQPITNGAGHAEPTTAEPEPTTAIEPPYVIETAAELAEPIPPLAWLCQGLRLARGSITIVGGYGYSRKTLYAQALALSVASGKRALDVYAVDQQPALHIDYEQGKRITRERYQRLARAMGVELADALLSVVTFPRFKLSSIEARDTLRRLLEESRAKFVVLDSLRASVSGVDENSSEIREYIDLVGQECKRVDAAGIVIHHARKPSVEGKGGRYSLRGSGAIFDACDGVFIFSGEKGEPTTVEHEKDRLVGTELPKFGLDTADVQGEDGDPRWGLRLVHQEAAQMAEAEQARGAKARDEKAEEAGEAIRTYLRKLGGSFAGSKTQLRDAMGMSRPVFFAALATLETEREITLAGTQRAQRIDLQETSDE